MIESQHARAAEPRRQRRRPEGTRIGRLIVLEYVGRCSDGYYRYRCKCDCGKEILVQKSGLCINKLRGEFGTQSCGCLATRKADARHHAWGRGLQFGSYTVLEFAGRASGNGDPMYRCRCLCGREKFIRRYCLEKGQATHCGCRRIAHTKSPEYGNWLSMRERARNNVRYISRGIRVCAQWEKSFPQFLADMGPKPSPRHTVDRVDNAKGYEPLNCRWAVPKTQANNREVTRIFSCNGESHTIAEWGRILGVKKETLLGRIRKWGDVERAFLAPVNKRGASIIAPPL